jgi:hypothetical protein
MTRMIPPTVHSSVRSGAERRLFRVIEDARDTSEWVCLHSLGLAEHDAKRRAEIDFCLVTPDGVYVLEVKGGRIKRTSGEWQFTDRFGNTYTKAESPFTQASTAMFALERQIKDRFRDSPVARVAFGFGVVFPDVEFDSAGTEAAQQQIYDVRDRRSDFGHYMRRLIAYTRSRHARAMHRLAAEEVKQIVDYLRGDFDLVPSFVAAMDETRAELAQLTREQMAVLDAANDCRRLIVDGSAGSGKTLLAMESARRDARNAKRVLYLCYNRLLSTMASAKLHAENYAGTLIVRTVHGYFHDLIERSSLKDEFKSDAAASGERDLYDRVFPEYAALAALELPTPPVEVLIIDEAQDVLTKPTMKVLSEVLVGGLKSGSWRLFLDANDQACVYGRMDPQVLASMRDVAEREAVLTFNCRNTRPIGLHINAIAQPSRRTACRASGPPVEVSTYQAESELMGKLENILNRLRSEKIPAGTISVLFAVSLSDSDTRRLAKMGVLPLADENVVALGKRELEQPTWSLVSGFKGLENDVVILVGVADIESPWWRSVTYVGLSRARVRLFLLINERCSALRETRFAEELARLEALQA